MGIAKGYDPWNQMLESLGRHECDLKAVSVLDILFGYRMLCGQNHLQNSVELFQTACGARNEAAVLLSDPNPGPLAAVPR